MKPVIEELRAQADEMERSAEIDRRSEIELVNKLECIRWSIKRNIEGAAMFRAAADILEAQG